MRPTFFKLLRSSSRYSRFFLCIFFSHSLLAYPYRLRMGLRCVRASPLRQHHLSRRPYIPSSICPYMFQFSSKYSSDTRVPSRCSGGHMRNFYPYRLLQDIGPTFHLRFNRSPRTQARHHSTILLCASPSVYRLHVPCHGVNTIPSDKWQLAHRVWTAPIKNVLLGNLGRLVGVDSVCRFEQSCCRRPANAKALPSGVGFLRY